MFVNSWPARRSIGMHIRSVPERTVSRRRITNLVASSWSCQWWMMQTNMAQAINYQTSWVETWGMLRKIVEDWSDIYCAMHAYCNAFCRRCNPAISREWVKSRAATSATTTTTTTTEAWESLAVIRFESLEFSDRSLYVALAVAARAVSRLT
jgi:hypothetical protein